MGADEFRDEQMFEFGASHKVAEWCFDMRISVRVSDQPNGTRKGAIRK